MWNWARPRRDLPEVNYNESSSSEEDLESGLNFDSPFRSPQGQRPQGLPLPTRAGSPNLNTVEGGPTLADNVDDILEEAQYKLHDIAETRAEVEEITDLLKHADTSLGGDKVLEEHEVQEEIVDTGLTVGDKSSGEVEAIDDGEEEAIMPEQAAAPAPPVDFDAEEKEDGEKAQDQARSIKLEFNATDIKFWFAQLEDEMLMASVGSQWLKKTVLQRNLPNKQKEDVKSLLTLPKSEAGTHIYRTIKRELLRIYSPKAHDSYKKALTRQMVGLPSQLGYQIIDDICKKSTKLSGCCCASAALALWSLQLPVNIRAHISNREFNINTYKSVFEAADQVYLSSKQLFWISCRVAV